MNNAVTSISARFDELTDDEFQYYIDVNLMAYIRVALKALPTMATSNPGELTMLAVWQPVMWPFLNMTKPGHNKTWIHEHDS